MGYKLAGFDVLGCNEIDPKMMSCYIENHNPKYSFLEPIQTFKLRNDLPLELYNLDILDGSPPCSSFSMAGNREKDWGKDKVFREGQAMQVLDTLFFDFIDLAEKLQPKVVIAENVKGLIMGGARKYLKAIYKAFDKAGYTCQCHLLNASKMGVPQRRERVFFICMRKDLANERMPKLDLLFGEKGIKNKEFATQGKNIGNNTTYIEKRFGDVLINQNKTFSTVVTRNRYFFDLQHYVSDDTLKMAGSYPIDYDFKSLQVVYLTGMSVPPVMTAQIATRVYEQWISKF